MAAGRGTTIVLGPRTRAGLAVSELASGRGEQVVLVARHAADATAVAGRDAEVASIEHDLDLGAGDGPVRLVVCALGPVHPVAVDAPADSTAFLRDLDFIERVLGATSARPVSVVLVSSIIALAPGPDRRYYGGWKNLVEQQLAATVAAHSPAAAFSVVYPGRIVDGPAARRVPGLHTTYVGLAQTIERLVEGPSRARVSGIDARLWIVVNSLKLLVRSVLPLRPPVAGRSLAPSVSATERYSR